MDKLTYLFIVPHADDEVLGFGGTIAKLSEQGHKVVVTILQAPNNERASKQLKDSYKAKDVLGYSELNFLYISCESICNDLFLLKEAIEKHIKKINPDIVYTTFKSDNHQDHKNLYKAVCIATRQVYMPNIKSIYVGEVISSYDQSYGIERRNFIPNVYEELSTDHVNKKINALNCYTTEAQPYPHPRSDISIKSKAVVRGTECGCNYAEAFMVLRDIRHV